MTFALVYYAVDARKWFKGPRVNVEHLIYTEPTEGVSQPESVSDNVDRVAEKS